MSHWRRAAHRAKQLARIVLRQAIINLMICPKLCSSGSLGGVRPHIVCLGQINGVFVASWFCHSLMPKESRVATIIARIPNVFNLDVYKRGDPLPYLSRIFRRLGVRWR